MFSNTAYEAYFVSLGVYLNSGITKFLASNEFFRALMMFIVAFTLMAITFQYFSRYLPGSLFERKFITLSKFGKFIVCFFLGVSLLQIGTNVDIKDYARKSWKSNPYLVDKLSKEDEDYRISFVFDLLIRTIEEIGWGATKVIDHLMSENHSHLKAPDFFYKALLYAGASQIESPELQEKMEMYSRDCVLKALTDYPQVEHKSWFGKLHSDALLPEKIDTIYRNTIFEKEDGSTYSCNDIRLSINQALHEESISKAPMIEQLLFNSGFKKTMSTQTWVNMEISSRVLNFYRSQRESSVGIKEGAAVPGMMGSVLQFLSKVKSFEGIMRLTGNEDVAGASLAIDKAREFNDLQRKAPMIKGLVKMFLIGLAPLLVFAIFALNWKILVWWIVAYSSVTIGWSVAWTFLYHTMTNFVAAGNMMSHFGMLSDGYSLTAAKMIMEDAYFFYSVIFMAQMLSAAAMTGGALFFTRSLLSDNATDHVPDILPAAANTAVNMAAMRGIGV